MNNPKISIVLPTRNRPQNLEIAMDSVLSQTYKNYELIIVDSSDTEESYLSIYSALQKNLNVVYIKSDVLSETLAEKYNQGLEVANGDYACFLNETSSYVSTALSDLVEAVKDYDLVYGRIYTFDYLSEKSLYNSFSAFSWDTDRRILQKEDSIHISSVMVKKSLFNSLGGFDKDLKKSYPLNLWNRIFNNFDFKVKRISNIISEVAINDPSDPENSYPSDFTLTNLFTKDYPLKNYWWDLKSVTFNYGYLNISDNFNNKKSPWISTTEVYDSDVIVQESYSPNLVGFSGDLIYYYDYREPLDNYLISNCKAIISPVDIDTSTFIDPVYVLRPCVSKNEIEKLDTLSVRYPDELVIGCPDIDNTSLDFFLNLIPELYSRYKKVTIYHNPQVDIWHLLGNYEHLRCFKLDFSDLTEVKQKGLSFILSVNQDYDNFEDAHNLFFMGTKLLLPLISLKNAAFKNLMEDGKHLYFYDSGVSLCNAYDKTKILTNMSSMLKEARALTYMEFLDTSVVDRLIVFLNDVYTKNVIPFGYNIDISQMESNNGFYLVNNTIITQSFTCAHNNLKAIQVFLELNSNYGELKLTLETGGNFVSEATLPAYKLKNGSNIFEFSPILLSSGKKFNFFIHSFNLLGKLDYIDSVKSVGNLWKDGEIKKACLKFQSLY